MGKKVSLMVDQSYSVIGVILIYGVQRSFGENGLIGVAIVIF